MKFISKWIVTAIASLFGIIAANAQRYSDDRLYDIVGLADSDEIANALTKGIPLILIGFLIAYFTMWRKNNENKENKNNEGSYWGCFGALLIGIGFLVLIPLWTWIEAIATSVVSMISILAIVVAIVIFIHEKLKA